MRSILTKLAVVALVALGLMTQVTEASTLKSLVQHSAEGDHQTNMKPTRLAEALPIGSLANNSPFIAAKNQATRDWEDLAKIMDIDKNKKVYFNEMLQYYAKRIGIPPNQLSKSLQDVLRKNFEALDQNKNGYITESDYIAIYTGPSK